MNNLVIDNTMLDSFKSCHRKFLHRHEEGLTTQKIPAALSFGAAFHAALAASLKGNKKDKAIAIGLKSMRQIEAPTGGKEEWRTADRLIQILDVVLEQPPIEVIKAPNGEAVVEADFLFPLLEPSELEGDKSIELTGLLHGTGYDNILYSGILDAVATFFGETYVVDHKTTTDVGGAQGEPAQIRSSFLNGFKPHSATMGYAWGLSKFLGKPIYGVLINGVGVHSMRVNSSNFTVKDWLCFTRFTVNYTPEEIEEWRQNTIETIKELLRCKLSGCYPMSTGSCYNYNKACPYLPMCSRPPSQRQAMKEGLYIKDVWNPLQARKKEASKLGIDI